MGKLFLLHEILKICEERNEWSSYRGFFTFMIVDNTGWIIKIRLNAGEEIRTFMNGIFAKDSPFLTTSSIFRSVLSKEEKVVEEMFLAQVLSLGFLDIEKIRIAYTQKDYWLV